MIRLYKTSPKSIHVMNAGLQGVLYFVHCWACSYF